MLLVNLRTYDMELRKRVIEGIERMVKGECEASGSPKPPEFEYYDQYPLTDNNSDVTEKITSVFMGYFGEEAMFDLGHQTASEDSSRIPEAFGTPYTFWSLRGTGPEQYEKGVKAGRVKLDIPVNHSEYYAPNH